MADAGRAPTMQIRQLAGVWAAVYQHRDRLEQHTADQVLTAWRAVGTEVDLTAVTAVLRHLTAPVETDQGTDRQHVRQVVAAAVLARMVRLTTRPGWPALIGTLTAGMRGSRAAGVRAGHAVANDDAAILDDDTGDEDLVVDDDSTDVSAAYTAAAAALRGTAQTIASTLLTAAEQGDDEQAMQDQADADLTTGSAWSLAATTTAAAAFLDGMLTAYKDRSVLKANFLTVVDDRVCLTCANAEDGNPYPLAAVPPPPLHPSCRCIVQPAN